MHRRPFLQAVTSLSAATLASTAGCLSAFGDERGSIEDRDRSGYDDGTVAWPEDGFDAANTGYNPDAELLEADLESTQVTTDGSGINTSLGAGVTVVEDRLYFGTVAGDIVCYGDGGERRWSYEADPQAGVHSIPTVTSEVVYVTSDNGSYALDADDGEELWTNDAWIRWGSSVHAGDRIYAFESGSAFSSGPDAVAIDPDTGSIDWRAGTPVAEGLAVADGVVYATGSREAGGVAAFADGERLWSRTGLDQFFSPPAVSDDVVLACTRDGRLYALERDGGETVWEFDRGAGSSITPAVAHGRVYLPAGSQAYGIDLESGDRLWSISTGTTTDRPTAVADGVYFGTPNEGLFAVEPDGTVRWREEDLRLRGPIAAVGDRLAVVPSAGPFGDGNLYLVEN
ncbi:outer membrane protein assembly factor BamB family protein [Natronobacterium gregoryi]|uniref:Pyrrolo-quinoline quinone n=2 Tax=Natronobacterium gregoryi TaxID=44930 RepID=L0AID2_NATGS|nr:PQQ-binding-like beta-propeller repeat protein [Natronobacterium gregoryi]AFZ73566.1 WD40-like repeat protein [Natronobacterium gregoryi SP2]ELY68233.1 pyrrolo-quinoline quinone [Natronobacterium gregoryi SP2]PLK20534.1 hypothetical protein CYV19_08805 [Natronobacterium gregoryi SP2]SFJ17832.1 Outer membrane protein assembly factor BamB, contains PQQ-like beta-propeller repeat [Natronobacterium gregoryi]